MMNKKTPPHSDDLFEAQINDALDKSVEDLTPDIRRQLNQARIKATKKSSRAGLFWKSATAFSIAFVLVITWQSQIPQNNNTETPFADVLQEDLDMLDDLEFIYWMSEEADSATL